MSLVSYDKNNHNYLYTPFIDTVRNKMYEACITSEM